MLLLIATGVVKTSLLKGIAWLSGVPWWLCFWKVRHEEPQTHCSSCPRGRVWGSGTSLLSPCHPSRHETLGVWRSSPAKSRCHFFSAATPSPQALRRVGAPTPLRGRRVLLLPPESPSGKRCWSLVPASQYSNSSVLTCTRFQSAPFPWLRFRKTLRQHFA